MLSLKLISKLKKREEENAFRQLYISHGIDFSSNDYLGFARNKHLKELLEAQFATADCMLGTGGSRLISGNTFLAETLEKELASFYGYESALIFNSGYDANLGLLASVPQRGDTIIYDELIHASLHDGRRLSNANTLTFSHNNTFDLQQKLQSAAGDIYVVIESIYSMDGTYAKMEEIISLCKKYGAYLIVDEAHSNGICGPHGKGLSYSYSQDIFACIFTFGKALGCHGAVICGSPMLKSYLINYARPFIYSTALPAHSLLSIKNAVEYLPKAENERKKLQSLSEYFVANLSAGLKQNLIADKGPIFSICIPGNDTCKQKAKLLQARGFAIKAILHPTVAQGKERIRICIHSYNTQEEIAALAQALNSLSEI